MEPGKGTGRVRRAGAYDNFHGLVRCEWCLRHQRETESAVARIKHGARLLYAALLDDNAASDADIDRVDIDGTAVDREQK